MSFHSDAPGLRAERVPSQSPPANRGPEMYRLDPHYEIRDEPKREIGDDLIAPIVGDSTRIDAASPRYQTR